ncbi:MAG: mercuric transporter MerT family protein [Pseudomonadota bacterium]|nr:mercuric transporter MerT family protein [Pseudomonadota bacterium]
MADDILARPEALAASDRGVAAVSGVSGFGGLFSAAACCVLPLVLGALGLGAGWLSVFVPYHRPLTVAAALAVTIGWTMYVRKRRACPRDASCAVPSPSRSTFVMLSLATVFVALSAIWKAVLEAPLTAWLQGA